MLVDGFVSQVHLWFIGGVGGELIGWQMYQLVAWEWYWLLSGSCDKTPRPRQLIEERVYLDLWVQKVRVHSSGNHIAAGSGCFSRSAKRRAHILNV